MFAFASIRSIRLLLILVFAIASLYYIGQSYSLPTSPGDNVLSTPSQLPTTNHEPSSESPPDDEPPRTSTGKLRQTGKTKATFVTLIRNHELWDILNSIRQIEDRFNRHYHYPWVFLNDVPFTEEFIEMTSKLVSGEVKYGTTPQERGLIVRSDSGGTLVGSQLDR